MALHEHLVPIEEQIKTQLTGASVCHFNETGLRVGGQLQWLHVACNALYTHLFVHPKRGQQALSSAQSLFGRCLNWTVHDCWASYFAASKGRHSLCGAHLLRELQALIDQGVCWADAMHGYRLEAYQASRYGPIVHAEQVNWLARYEQICQQGDVEELPALVLKKTNGRCRQANAVKGVIYWSG